MLDGRWKSDIEQRLQPVGQGLRRVGLTADQLTGFGLLMSIAASIAIANGALRGGTLLLLATALPDALDGAVAKASGTSSPRGAFFDSVADRVTDVVLLGGVSWFLTARHGGQAGMVALAVIGASALVSYQRAKAEALGFEAKGGLMERAERLILLGFGLLFDSLLVPVLWIMLVLTLLTAGQRFAKVWRQAGRPVPAPPSPSPLAARWRGRRVPRTTARTWHRRDRLNR
ncbi:MAG: CDP-alcohol phosphatidyltransferase family protein [Actinobacteria bacterium]|nr:CDP-alcohol phosphatidyltransferase family protein [Actinomycetota bacterium]MBI3256937.1 CDP-alcohol phosphatidyltransferase family protein [Actinomycetota bacterium]